MYPPEELIRFIARNYNGAKRRKVAILDLGCGTGSNSWYLAREGFKTLGVDGSISAIKISRKRLKKEGLKGNFSIADITSLPYMSASFDCVIAIASIQHNCKSDIGKILREVHRIVKKRGRLFSMMISVGTYGFNSGKKIERNTFTDISRGPCKGMGLTHFFEKKEILNSLKYFKDIRIESSTRTVNQMRDKIKHWVVEAQKP